MFTQRQKHLDPDLTKQRNYSNLQDNDIHKYTPGGAQAPALLPSDLTCALSAERLRQTIFILILKHITAAL